MRKEFKVGKVAADTSAGKIIDLGDARLLTGQTNHGKDDDGGATSWKYKGP
jgi:hypothetical protein